MRKAIITFFAILIHASHISAQEWEKKTDTLNIKLPDGIFIHSVLSAPKNTNNPPLALIIAGSGPTDLNGNQPNMQNNSLMYLSDALVKKNIATLRFDKRGIGKSSYPELSEADLTIDQYAKDVVSIIEYLKEKGYSNIYVIGHSEGSLIGLIALQKLSVRGFISISGAGNAADIILKKQLKPKLPPDFFNTVELIIDSLKNGNTVKQVPSQLNILFRASVQPYLISWFKYSPAELIKNIHAPVLIIQGNKDIQVDMEEARLLESAANNAEFAEIDNMNHILKTIQGDLQENIKSYNAPELGINIELTDTLENFINNHDK